MTPKGKKIVAILLLALLALPTGICSLAFTPMAIGSFFGRDEVERSIGLFALTCSAVGWMICGLTIWGAVRLHRGTQQGEPAISP